MKTLIVLLLLFVGYFASIATAQTKCFAKPRKPSCSQLRDQGRTGWGCRGGNRWYYNSSTRRCENFDYFGCGGNSNRYCTQADCQRQCHGLRGLLVRVGIKA